MPDIASLTCLARSARDEVSAVMIVQVFDVLSSTWRDSQRRDWREGRRATRQSQRSSLPRWSTLHAFATVSTSRRIHRLEVVAWSVHLYNESPVEEGRSLVLVAHLKVPGVATLEDRSWLQVRASEVLSESVQVAVIVGVAWVVDTVRLHLQSVDTGELIIVVVGRQDVAPSQVDTIFKSSDRVRAVGVHMQRGVVAVHVETNCDSLERGDV